MKSLRVLCVFEVQNFSRQNISYYYPPVSCFAEKIFMTFGIAHLAEKFPELNRKDAKNAERTLGAFSASSASLRFKMFVFFFAPFALLRFCVKYSSGLILVVARRAGSSWSSFVKDHGCCRIGQFSIDFSVSNTLKSD